VEKEIMADLFDRLFPADTTEENIPVHAFMAAITDYIAGETTRNQIIACWVLDASAQVDLNALCDNIDDIVQKINKIVFALELDSTMILCEGGLKYITKTAFKNRLGI